MPLFEVLDPRGRAVQVESMNPTLKAPGYERLKLEYEKLLPKFAFDYNLRCYTGNRGTTSSGWSPARRGAGRWRERFTCTCRSAGVVCRGPGRNPGASSYTRKRLFFSRTWCGSCRPRRRSSRVRSRAMAGGSSLESLESVSSTV